MDIVQSKNGVPIRLTEERWLHITEEHSELAGNYFEVLETIETPLAVYEGKAQELLAISEFAPRKFLVVVYKETNDEDGFVITAFITSKIKKIERRKMLWP